MKRSIRIPVMLALALTLFVAAVMPPQALACRTFLHSMVYEGGQWHFIDCIQSAYVYSYDGSAQCHYICFYN